MLAEDNKALVRRFVDEVQSGGNIDLIDEICSPEFVNHSAPLGLPADRGLSGERLESFLPNLAVFRGIEVIIHSALFRFS